MDMAEKDATEGRCPACRTPYDKDRIVGLEANFQRFEYFLQYLLSFISTFYNMIDS